jgi:hypothetical protein
MPIGCQLGMAQASNFLSAILDTTMKVAILGIKLTEEDKAVIRKIASENRLTMSAIVRLGAHWRAEYITTLGG